MMMTLARQISAADRSMCRGKWEKSRFVGVELAGKVLGLVGCGNIGSIVTSRAQGLHMRVISYNPFLAPERALELGTERVVLDDLMSCADVISVHAPLNDATRGLIGARCRRGTRCVHERAARRQFAA